MNYENAKDVLPEELLKQVQNYAAGKLLYVPIGNEGNNWGEVSMRIYKTNYYRR